MSDASFVISNIVNWMNVAFNVLDTEVFPPFTWLDICITFFVFDIIIGAIFYLIRHPEHRPIDDYGSYPSYLRPDVKYSRNRRLR